MCTYVRTYLSADRECGAVAVECPGAPGRPVSCHREHHGAAGTAAGCVPAKHQWY